MAALAGYLTPSHPADTLTAVYRMADHLFYYAALDGKGRVVRFMPLPPTLAPESITLLDDTAPGHPDPLVNTAIGEEAAVLTRRHDGTVVAATPADQTFSALLAQRRLERLRCA